MTLIKAPSLKIIIICLLSLYSCSLFASTPLYNSDTTEKNNSGTEHTFSQKINQAFVPFVAALEKILFWDPFYALGLYDQKLYDEKGKIIHDNKGNTLRAPLKLIVLWLIFGGLFFTLFLRFINIRGFKHAFALIRGKYDKKGDEGEVSHFQALTTALSATVGLGNIAGVAIAVSIGGAGSVVWMILAGFLGMSSKFAECTLGVKYRKISARGKVSGGAMYYLSEGLKKKKLRILGKILAFTFAVLVIGGSVGGGNMLQSNQAFQQFAGFFPFAENHGAYYGLVLAFFVGLVIIGGIKSIARVSARIVPIMAIIYVLSALIIIGMHISYTGEALRMIIHGAFSPDAMKGGFIGVLIYGFQRGAFSNEAGVGSASIAHAAAKTKEPVSEGIVALLEPFIDTVIICTMTALVLIFTGFCDNTSGLEGVSLTSAAFGSVLPWFPYILVIAVLLFAFSTMISWSYYGQKGFDYLFGDLSQKLFGTRIISDTTFKLIFLACIVVGASSTLNAVMDFSDMMVLCMAFPNMIGLIILAPEIKKDLRDYMSKLKKKQL